VANSFLADFNRPSSNIYICNLGCLQPTRTVPKSSMLPDGIGRGVRCVWQRRWSPIGCPEGTAEARRDTGCCPDGIICVQEISERAASRDWLGHQPGSRRPPPEPGKSDAPGGGIGLDRLEPQPVGQDRPDMCQPRQRWGPGQPAVADRRRAVSQYSRAMLTGAPSTAMAGRPSLTDANAIPQHIKCRPRRGQCCITTCFAAIQCTPCPACGASCTKGKFLHCVEPVST
jgi:hypothetical protein